MSEPVRSEEWTAAQRRTLFAGVGAWALDAFDYFVLVFVLSTLATSLHVTVVTATLAITFTLLMRPVGAVVFGPLAERFGRKPVLIANIVVFSLLELATAASPDFATFLVLRIVYGVAMGGIWGVASALTMETVPRRSRGVVSGLFQAGYPIGYLLASVVYGTVGTALGWRGMFALGAVPVLLAVFVALRVQESPVWLASRAGGPATTARVGFWPAVRVHWPVLVFAVVLMAAFNYFSHGTQDIYPTFLKVQHGFSASTVSIIAICYNIAAIIGALVAGTLSERLGRKRVIILFAALSLPVIPLWALASGSFTLGLGAFVMQFLVQGAWGVIPAYLNELVPEGTRAVLPGFVYQLGNVIASPNATLQASIASSNGGDYGMALAIVAGAVAVVIVVLMAFSRETRGRTFVEAPARPAVATG